MDFTIIPNEVMNNKNLSHGAFKLYSVLASYCYGDKNTCYPSQATLAERMGVSVRTVRRYLQELIDAGLVQKKRRGSISNLYTLLKKIILTTANKAKEVVTIAKEVVTITKENISNKNKKKVNNNTRNYNADYLKQLLLGRVEYDSKKLYKK